MRHAELTFLLSLIFLYIDFKRHPNTFIHFFFFPDSIRNGFAQSEPNISVINSSGLFILPTVITRAAMFVFVF